MLCSNTRQNINDNTKVHFVENKQDEIDILKSNIASLSKQIANMQISNMVASVAQTNIRTRSPSPFNYHNDITHGTESPNQNDAQYYTRQQQQPYCTRCLCHGHFAYQCRIMQNRSTRTFIPQNYQQTRGMQFQNSNRPYNNRPQSNYTQITPSTGGNRNWTQYGPRHQNFNRSNSPYYEQQQHYNQQNYRPYRQPNQQFNTRNATDYANENMHLN
jgi:hypothetical protein